LKKGWIKSEEEIRKFTFENDQIINKGGYKNLLLQANKLARHAKGISITSQRQYYNHFDHFLRFAADQFNMKKIANISVKHLKAYIEVRQLKGCNAGTIKNDLASIRYFHDQLPKAKFSLPANNELVNKHNISLERRSFGGVNRRWTELEYQQMKNIAHHLKHPNTAYILQLAREQGLRIHEAVRLSRTDIEKAIRTNYLTVKGKGGLIRKVPLRERTKILFANLIKNVQRGQKMFVPEGKKAHEVIRGVQGFVKHHRKSIEETAVRTEGVNLTVHGLRHTYAYEEYEKLIKLGCSEKDARYKVSLLIGHSREDVTKIYLAK
jgi:integrase/recombinase XerD